MKIDIWSDIACPWCSIGLTRFDRALRDFEHRNGVEVTLHSFQLDPTLPDAYDGTETQYLAQRKGMPEATVREMFTHVSAAAESEGLTMDFDTLKVANSRRAHRLLHAAASVSADVAWRLKMSLFQAHFADGESIADADVLVRLAGEVGMDAETARAALDDEALDAEVARDIETARSLGISGVPFFVLHDKYGISGAQPLEVFAQALNQVWEEVHPKPAFETLSIPGLKQDATGP
ncbi:MAG: DsbA family oxidoreductase, partial [Propionibacteriaceae bacterium]|nr:DsbA family oxidoreductase [Propionibacteriaceae bacterium]